MDFTVKKGSGKGFSEGGFQKVPRTPPWRVRPLIRESFCESGEGVRLPRERADLRGSPGDFRGSLGNFRGSLGNFRGTPGLLLSSTVREPPGKSPKNFRGKFGELPGKPGNFPEARGSLTPSQRLAKFISNLSRAPYNYVLPNFCGKHREKTEKKETEIGTTNRGSAAWSVNSSPLF